MVDAARLEVILVPDTKELEKTLKKYQGEKVQVETTMPGASKSGGSGASFGASGGAREGGGVNGSGASFGASGGAGEGGGVNGSDGFFESMQKTWKGVAVKIGAVVGVLYGIKKGIDLVNEQINDMDMRMREINPALKGQEDMLKKIQDLSLLPMSMVLTQFLKPYLLKMAMLSKQSMLAAQPTLEKYAAGEITLEEAMEELSPVFEKTTEEMSEINKDMETQKKKIQGNLEGTKDSIELMDKAASAAAGVFSYISSFSEGIIPQIDEIANPHSEYGILNFPFLSGAANMFEKGKSGETDSFGGLIKDFFLGAMGLQDFLVSDNKVYSIDPEDTVVGYKGRSNPTSNTNNNVTVNLHVDGFLDDTTITTIANEVRRATERGIG